MAAKSCTDLIDLAKFNLDKPSGKFDDFALNFAERDGKFRANLRALRRILLSLKKRVNFIAGQICPASSSRALPASTRHVLVAAAYAPPFRRGGYHRR